jgi:hypothetical protein
MACMTTPNGTPDLPQLLWYLHACFMRAACVLHAWVSPAFVIVAHTLHVHCLLALSLHTISQHLSSEISPRPQLCTAHM